jgi:hypothetical protein
VFVGRVTGVTSYDDGRVNVVRLSVERTIKGGEERSEALIVDVRDLPSTPPLLETDENAVALLTPAARNSYLDRTLPPGTYFQPTRGRESLIASSDSAAVGEAAALVERLVAASRAPEPDAAKRAAASRALIFEEIGARHGALVEDGARRLREVHDLSKTLEPAERARLEEAVARSDLPPRVRATVLDEIAANRLVALAPAIVLLNDAPPEVLAAAWTARAKLGTGPTKDELAPFLLHRDEGVRAVAVGRWIGAAGPAGVAQVQEMALTDAAPAVRLAAIQALGECGLPEALPALEKVFSGPDGEDRKAAGREIFKRGGRSAAVSFAHLAETGPRDAQAYAVTLLLALGVGRDDPLVKHIAKTHPDPQVREIASHGLPRPEH